eukprot:134343_1
MLFTLVLALFAIAESRPRASTCTVVPAGSNMTAANGDNIVFFEPIVAGKCEVHVENNGGGTHVESLQVTCNGTTAALLTYGHEVGDCSGTATSTPITVNGTCGSMTCLGFNDEQYDTADCTGTPYQNHTNEYVYWSPDVCQYNTTQTCVNGQPQSSFYNNSACTGTPVAVILAGQCTPQGHKKSVQYNATDNPCGSLYRLIY